MKPGNIFDQLRNWVRGGKMDHSDQLTAKNEEIEKTESPFDIIYAGKAAIPKARF